MLACLACIAQPPSSLAAIRPLREYEHRSRSHAANSPSGASLRSGLAPVARPTPYYCVFEADFDDAAALSAARESPEGQALRADVPNYATGGAVVLNYELRAD
jgi:hypothetical protein